jgi:hypothetical protein
LTIVDPWHAEGGGREREREEEGGEGGGGRRGRGRRREESEKRRDLRSTGSILSDWYKTAASWPITEASQVGVRRTLDREKVSQ